ncbi:MAG: TAXI family TRAP transporter solute-binding subunit [Geminicoccaceae bacterium]
MNKNALVSLAVAWLVMGTTAPSAQEVTEIRWGTSAVGSSGHRALTTLANLLNEEMDGYQVIVQPTPGAIVSVKGFATGEFEGYYGADIAFYELANNISRFEGFQASIEKQPVQSFWAFTVEVGLGVHASQRENFAQWTDLSGQRLFTGPRPWDTRAQIERALEALGVEHEYVDVDLSTAGSLLESGQITGFLIYTNAEATTAPWIIETSLMTDWAIVNPSEEELARLHEAGFASTEVTNAAEVFQEDSGGAEQAILLPFYYGFHVGLEVPEEDVYRMLQIIDENAAELAQADAGFAQIAEDMPGMQVRGVTSSVDLVPIHPGLARYMREKGVWNPEWDSRIATQ